MTKPTINIFSENIYEGWQVDEAKLIAIGRKILKYYMLRPDIYEGSCLKPHIYDTISFDILYCDGAKTHEINREYRDKDYVADIITFDGEINLGEIILALDKITQSAKEKGVTKEEELCFLLAHGIMHLLGYDHQTEEDYNFVVAAQKMALNKIKDKNV